MKTKSKSVKRKICDTDIPEYHMMGIPKKPVLSSSPTSSYTPTEKYGEGSCSNDHGYETGISGMVVDIQDGSAHIDFINNNISPCNLTSGKNTSCAAPNINTPNTPSSNARGLSGNHDMLSIAATTTQTPASASNTQTTPSTSRNTLSTRRRQRTNAEQITNEADTSRKRSRQQIKFVPHTERTHQSIDISNNANVTSKIQLRNQQTIHTSTRRQPNSIPLEYIHMGRCSCICRYCGATFWECEKLGNSGSGPSAIYNRCCNGGQVVLRPPPEYPPYIKSLFADPHFMENIRAYNQMFSMTSLGANIDTSINNGRGPYVFRISGQIYHWIGSMCPQEGDMPRFLQLYIYDTTNEVQNRMAHFGGEEQSGLKREIVEGLIDFLDNHNALVQLFRTARNKRMELNIPEFKLRLYNVIGTRQYELPTAETIGAIIFGGRTANESEFDLIVEEHSRIPQRVNKLHPCYMSLQFPLLFVYGEEGYQTDMKLVNVPSQASNKQRRMSMNMYYAYQIHDRVNHYSLLPRGGKLFQQYVVTAYCAIEQSRLDYIRQNQNHIRNEYLSGIYDAILRGDRDGRDLGTRTVLTAGFTGGPRYMYAHYLDALAICRVHGNPSFFITFTCNAKWPEIQEYMDSWPELTTADRADIVDRVFEQKVRDYIKFVRNTKLFGDITAVLYTIEFQKRGLPHCHSLLWVSPSSKIHQDTDVDKYISAELPDPMHDPDGYRVISELMIHGPCGYANKNAACMKDGNKCNRNFPKPYCSATYIDKDGFVHYRRRHTNVDTERQQTVLLQI